jgi:two-component system, NtrC family, sensor histidine kinase PilS
LPAPSSNPSKQPTTAGPSDPVSNLRLKLTWLTVFRTVATTLLLAAIVARLASNSPVEDLSRADSLSLLLIGLVYLLTLVYGLVLRSGWAGASTAYAQVMGDVVLASCLVYLTGGVESPFTFTYSIAVVAASILLFQRGALIAAGASTLAFATLTFAIQAGLLKPPLGTTVISTSRVVFVLVSNTLAQFLIAALASYLSRQLTAAGGRLSEREADLKELVGLQNQIVAAMPSGLITCEADGQITFVNPAAAAILGIGSNGSRPSHLDQLIPDALKLKPYTRRAELTVQTGAGMRILGLAVTPLEGKTGSLLIVFQDLTELRRTEDELRRADHLASLGRLSAQLAHEIRNPLASMRGSAQMLAEDAKADATSGRLANILVRESDRLSSLVDDFLRFARPPPPVLKQVSLKTLAHETVEMLRADPLARGVKIEEELSDLEAPVDAGQIRQVLINLLRNAFAAVTGAGTVRIHVDEDAVTARFRVWDSAGSIPAQDLTRIFDPFYTTREAGTGLGLSTAHSIIRAHGGMIHVSSSPANGTEFVVNLPKWSEESRADPGGR